MSEKNLHFGVNDKNNVDYYTVDINRTHAILREHLNEHKNYTVVTRAKFKDFIWSNIKLDIQHYFNVRLKAAKEPIGTISASSKYDRMLGKELCVLAWALSVDKSDITEVANLTDVTSILEHWLALRPEERWLLYYKISPTTNTHGNVSERWCKALYYMFTA